MNDRDRYERNRNSRYEQRGTDEDWDRGEEQSLRGGRYGYGYPGEESHSRSYSRLGGAGEEDYERYQGRGGQGRDFQSRDFQGRDFQGRDYGDERGYYGEGRNYGQERGGQYGGRQRERDWGNQRDWTQRGPSGRNSQYDYRMRDFGERSGYSYGGPEDSGDYGQGGGRQSRFSRRGSFGGQAGREQRGRFGGLGPKGYKRSDERIREDVSDALMMDEDIDASEIEVRVSDGEVTLTGTVSDRDDKYQVEQLCDSIPGVRDVHNTIRVRRREDSSSSSESSQRSSRAQQGTTSNMNPSSSNNSRA